MEFEEMIGKRRCMESVGTAWTPVSLRTTTS